MVKESTKRHPSTQLPCAGGLSCSEQLCTRMLCCLVTATNILGSFRGKQELPLSPAKLLCGLPSSPGFQQRAVSPREAGNRAVASSPLQCNRQFATQREKERSSCTISQQVVEKLEAETPLPVPRCPQDAHPRFSTLLQPCFTPLACPQQRKHVPAPSQLCSVPSSMQELKCLLVFRSELAPHAG